MQVLRKIFEFYPGYNYIKIWSDLIFFSGTYFSSGESRFIKGRPLTIQDLGSRYSKSMIAGHFSFPSILDSLWLILRNTIIYYVITILAELTLEQNQGISRSVWSALKACCGCGDKKKSGKKGYDYSRLESPPDNSGVEIEPQAKQANNEGSNLEGFELTEQDKGLERELSPFDDDDDEESQIQEVKGESRGQTSGPTTNHKMEINGNRKELDFSSDQSPTLDTNSGIWVENLQKHFQVRGLCESIFCQKGKIIKACDGINLRANENELLTILGQNGAGKTTLINILTGYLEATSGQATVCGLDVKANMSKIRRLTSLCPQFDIYWPDLTVSEHVRIFGVIKGFSLGKELEKEVTRTLGLVGLRGKANARVSHLSGGMRRRLSIAVSSIGDPKVIFFDEPTTGLDPVTKDQILQLIKSNTSYVL